MRTRQLLVLTGSTLVVVSVAHAQTTPNPDAGATQPYSQGSKSGKFDP